MLLEVLVKYLCCCHLLFARCARLFQNKYLLEIFPFLGNNCKKPGNMRSGTVIVNRCITIHRRCLEYGFCQIIGIYYNIKLQKHSSFLSLCVLICTF